MAAAAITQKVVAIYQNREKRDYVINNGLRSEISNIYIICRHTHTHLLAEMKLKEIPLVGDKLRAINQSRG